MLKNKREQFRIELRKGALDKLFLSSRKVVQQDQGMFTTEDVFFKDLEQGNKTIEDLLELLKSCEEQFNKERFTTIIKNQFEGILEQFNCSEIYLECLIHIFLHLKTEDYFIIGLMHKHNILYKLQEPLQQNVLNGKSQQLIIFFYGQMVQYSQIYRVAIKNFNIINMVLQLIDTIGVSNLDVNFYECFNFLVWSFITPKVDGMEAVIDYIFNALLELSIAFENMVSQFLLSALFRSAQQISSCANRLIHFKAYDQIIKQLSNENIAEQTVIDFIDFINQCQINHIDININKEELVQLLLVFLNKHYDEVKIKTIYLIQEQKIKGIQDQIIQLICRSSNAEVIQAFFSYLCGVEVDNSSNQLLEAIIHAVSFQEQQLVQVWQYIHFIVNKIDLRNPKLKYLIEKQQLTEQNGYIMELMSEVLQKIE